MLVEPHEDVCRLCFAAEIPVFRNSGHPNQVDPATGLLYIQEIGWDEISQSGFSLQRRALYSLAEAMAEAARRDAVKSEAKGRPVNYRLAGTLITQVNSINQIAESDGRQIFQVLATPVIGQPGKIDQPGHAEIRIMEGMSKDVFLKFRLKLRDALGVMREAELLDEA